jgi:hypothetical protein
MRIVCSNVGGKNEISDAHEPGIRLGDVMGDQRGDLSGVDVLEDGDTIGGLIWPAATFCGQVIICRHKNFYNNSNFLLSLLPLH